MSDEQWFYTRDGQQVGPVSTDAIRAMAASGTLITNDYVWRAGMPAWATLGTIPELAGGIAQPPATGFVPPPAGAWALQPQLSYYAPTPGPPMYAGFWLRFAAALVDGVIIGIVGAIINALMEFLVGLTLSSQGVSAYQIRWANLVSQQIVGTVLGWLYAAFTESSAMQATYGKRMVGIRVTDLGGGRISFGRATGRHFAKWISGLTLLIGYLMAAWTDRKQALHDKIASCLVVKAPT